MKAHRTAIVADPTRWTGDDSRKSYSDEFLDDAPARVGRLESVLAAMGGALHDVNNVLTVLSGNLYLLTESVRDHPSLFDKSRGARNTAKRAIRVAA